MSTRKLSTTMPQNRHASRASFACVRCKKDKRRCDISQVLNGGGRPDRSCTPCRNKNEKCEVRHGEDKRSNRQSNDPKALHKRMQALEEFVRNASRADSQAFGQSKDDGNSDCLIEPVHRYADDGHSSMVRAFPSPTDSSSPGTQVTSFSISPQEGQSNYPATSHSDSTSNSLRSTSFSGQCSSEFNSISDRFPLSMDEVTLEGDSKNQDQYLGSASLFPYSERHTNTTKPSADIPSSEEKSNQQSHSDQEEFPEPEPIIGYLLDLFWQWQSSHLHVVDRAIFNRHRRIWEDGGGNGDRNFYTPCLLYAILALASMISLDKGVTRYSASSGEVAGQNFSKRARSLFELEIEHPTITTVQAALLLGCRYGAMIDNSLGWTYSGIAFRVASNLGLHLDCAKAVASGQMSSETAELRRRVFWGCHMEDNLFSAYCGRPTFFMDWDITVPVPEQSFEHLSQEEDHFSTSLLHNTSVLSIICSKILVGIYGKRRRNTANELALKASELHKELWQWHQNLPTVLTWPIDRNIVAKPQVFILHMNFYFTLILLHRPFLRFSQVSMDLKTWNLSPLNSTTTCAIAAANIAKLTINYRRAYNIRLVPSPVVHFIFIAGSIHLINFRLSKIGSYNLLLQTCMECLSEISKSYPIAQKAALVLQDAIERWKPSDEVKGPEHEPHIDQELGDSPENSENHASDFLAVELPPLEEFDRFIDAGRNQGHSLNTYSCNLPDEVGFHNSLGQVGNNCTFFGSGTDWLSDGALFETVDGDGCPWLYK